MLQAQIDNLRSVILTVTNPVIRSQAQKLLDAKLLHKRRIVNRQFGAVSLILSNYQGCPGVRPEAIWIMAQYGIDPPGLLLDGRIWIKREGFLT